MFSTAIKPSADNYALFRKGEEHIVKYGMSLKGEYFPKVFEILVTTVRPTWTLFIAVSYNGTLADVVLFGSFLLWAIFDFRTARQRDRLLFDRPATPAVDQPTPATVVAAPAASVKGTVLTIVLGAALWMFFVVYLHQKLIGVSPLGV